MLNVNDLKDNLEKVGYFSDNEIGYAVLGAVEGNLPLLIEGDPGVGKSSLAAALAKSMEIPLIRIQCYEGIAPESILYDYDYSRQLLVVSAIKDKLNMTMKDMSVEESVKYVANNVEFYGKDFLLERPILKALSMSGRKVLLIDEIDKASEEIEHTLLETLSDFAITIPEYGTVKCQPEDLPIVILTSNRYRELSSPLKRRCIYLYIHHKSAEEIARILYSRVSKNNEFCNKCANYLYQISQLDLEHIASISEGIAWTEFLQKKYGEDIEAALPEIKYSLGFLAKSEGDRKKILKTVFPEYQ